MKVLRDFVYKNLRKSNIMLSFTVFVGTEMSVNNTNALSRTPTGQIQNYTRGSLQPKIVSA